MLLLFYFSVVKIDNMKIDNVHIHTRPASFAQNQYKILPPTFMLR